MSVSLTWLGQAGFVVETRSCKVVIDPFFSDYPGRRYASPAAPPYLECANWFLATHEHLDHFDPAILPVLLQVAPDVRVVVPSPLVDAVVQAGFTPARVHGVKPGQQLELQDQARLHVIPAFHALSTRVPLGDGDTGDGPRFVGYCLTLGDLTIYHAGDTIVTPELQTAATSLHPDIAILPINGRDFYREQLDLVGNMDSREAVQFATELNARVLVPMHWDMFESNSVRVAAVLDEVERTDAELHVLALRRFRELRLTA